MDKRSSKNDNEPGTINHDLKPGQIRTLQSDNGSLIIGRGEPLPIEESTDDDDYPEVKGGKSDYDSWLG